MSVAKNAKKNSKSKANSKPKTHEDEKRDMLAEWAMDGIKAKQRERLWWEQEVGAVLAEIMPQLSVLIIDAGEQLAARRRGVKKPGRFAAENAGRDIMQGIVEFFMTCQFDDENGLYPLLHPLQLTPDHARDWFELDETEAE